MGGGARDFLVAVGAAVVAARLVVGAVSFGFVIVAVVRGVVAVDGVVAAADGWLLEATSRLASDETCFEASLPEALLPRRNAAGRRGVFPRQVHAGPADASDAGQSGA